MDTTPTELDIPECQICGDSGMVYVRYGPEMTDFDAEECPCSAAAEASR